MESLSKTYVNTHGQRLKVAFAETLLSLLHPIGKVRIVSFRVTIEADLGLDCPSRDQHSSVGQGN